MADVVLATEDLTVLGGPSSITVDLDFGTQGQRGSQTFVGMGQPNDPNTVIGQVPALFDMYINLLASDEEYLYMYQYQNVDGTNTWVKLVKLIPNHYSDNNDVTFTAGATTIQIPLTTLVNENLISELTPENFNVQVTVSGSTPAATSVSVNSSFQNVGGILHLQFTINAVEYSTGTWSAISGNKLVYLYITVV